MIISSIVLFMKDKYLNNVIIDTILTLNLSFNQLLLTLTDVGWCLQQVNELPIMYNVLHKNILIIRILRSM